MANAHVTVRDGKVGDFTYQSLDATVAHDATGRPVEARLERGAEWLTVRGTLPPAPVLRDEARRNTAPGRSPRRVERDRSRPSPRRSRRSSSR